MSTNAGGLQGRLYLIVLDDVHTDLPRTGLVKAAARRFIERNLADNDLAAVVTTSGRFEAVQDFTSNRRLLLAAVDTFVGQKLRSAVLEKLDSYQREMDLTGQDLGQRGKTANDAYDVERGQRARNTLLTLKNLAESLSGVHGRRKALVYISEGISYTTTNFEEWREISGNARTGVAIEGVLRDTITAASRANVSIYSIDPRGLTNLGDTSMEMNYVPDNPNLRLDSAGLQDELRLSQDSLRVLAEQTGGLAFVNSNDLGEAFDRVVRDNSSYYMLGYYPTNERRDNRFRRIEVRMNKPGLQVRARKGYVSPGKSEPAARRPAKMEGSAELADALNRPIPTSGLTLRANTASFKGAAANTSVAVTITVDGSGFTFAEKDGWIEDKLEVSVSAIDAKGIVRGSEHFDLNIRVRSESRPILTATGFRVISKIDVPPGKIQPSHGSTRIGRGSAGHHPHRPGSTGPRNAASWDERPHAEFCGHGRRADRTGGAAEESAADCAVDDARVPIERRAGDLRGGVRQRASQAAYGRCDGNDSGGRPLEADKPPSGATLERGPCGEWRDVQLCRPDSAEGFEARRVFRALRSHLAT